MAAPRKPRDPNAPKRVVKPREFILMYTGEANILGIAANAQEALDKVLADPQAGIKIVKLTPPRRARNGSNPVGV